MKRGALIRRLLFQFHLWGGLSLGVYAVLIGITGSLRVFHDEIAAALSPPPTIVPTTSPRFERIRSSIALHHPGWHVWALETPRTEGEAWRSYIQQGSTFRTIYADDDGRVVGESKSDGTWLRTAEQFHSNLLLPRGRLLNGIAGLGLVALACSGLLLWWPAPGSWRTAFRIVRTSSWKGLVYDLHRVGGVSVLVFVVLFGLTGGYFTWPAMYRRIAAQVLPTTPIPAARQVTVGARLLPLDDLVASARRVVPDTTLVRVIVPLEPREPTAIVLAHGTTESERVTRVSQVLVDGYTGDVVAADDYRARRIGDHIVNWMGPLHGGRFAGLGTRIVWALAGLSLPALFITGFLMWCNRVVASRIGRSAPARIRTGRSA